MCVRAKFWDRLILPQILVVFKSPTTKIDFVDFLQIQAAFWKTNYTTFSYLLMPIYGQDMSWNDFFDYGREISILLDFYRHLLLMELWLYNKIQCKETACVPLVLEWYRPRQNNHCECPSNRVHLMWADWKRKFNCTKSLIQQHFL